MCQLCLIYFYFFNIYICTKRYHGMHKYQQVNFFSNVVKSVRPTYGNKEELAPLRKCVFKCTCICVFRAPTPDAAMFRKICMSKRKNQYLWGRQLRPLDPPLKAPQFLTLHRANYQANGLPGRSL